ncbi:hypothetical protein N798_09965 [Knoellia flava TL1]|uniref:Uncharacterized protein n=1 Tax=Knoellia flava TL1 TaxID=1385518 RepID=A0ABR4XD75_9MICO|nr:hypothetical protein N798_09965 [Knoellia flava TL1]
MHARSVAAGIADPDGPPASPVWIRDLSVVGQRG